ncbi:hypothetical protein JCM30237_26490 [Halolamina litorea]|uniref:ArsR family transcriptional regulator n=1 Tax=Halolamina litorea TaxID=1515593 RepID=A0ABD6BN87_9EURY|nr:hypothetical protein [Halolamina litorea]
MTPRSPRVYRHVDDLTSAGLLTERTQYDAEGNHYKTYAAALVEATVRIEDGELTVDAVTGGDDEASPSPEGIEKAGTEPAEEIDRPE